MDWNDHRLPVTTRPRCGVVSLFGGAAVGGLARYVGFDWIGAPASPSPQHPYSIRAAGIGSPISGSSSCQGGHLPVTFCQQLDLERRVWRLGRIAHCGARAGPLAPADARANPDARGGGRQRCAAHLAQRSSACRSGAVTSSPSPARLACCSTTSASRAQRRRAARSSSPSRAVTVYRPPNPNPAYSASARLATGHGPTEALLWDAWVLAIIVLGGTTLRLPQPRAAQAAVMLGAGCSHLGASSPIQRCWNRAPGTASTCDSTR